MTNDQATGGSQSLQVSLEHLGITRGTSEPFGTGVIAELVISHIRLHDPVEQIERFRSHVKVGVQNNGQRL